MADARDLPGWPKTRLVKEVRRFLSAWGIRPIAHSRMWIGTWEWASKIANSYFHSRWPLPTEIASQYVFLLLLDIRNGGLLRLPYRAKEQMPKVVAQMIGLRERDKFPMLEGP